MAYIPPHTHDFDIPTPTPQQAIDGISTSTLSTPADVKLHVDTRFSNVDNTSDAQKAAGGPIGDALASVAYVASLLPVSAGLNDASASLQAAFAALDDVTLPFGGAYRIDQSFTIPANKRLHINGSVLTVSTGITLRIEGLVFAPSTAWIFRGAGTVVGVRHVYAEWFGAVGDWNGITGTDDLPALQRAYNCIYDSYDSDGGRPTLQLLANSYRCHGNLVATPELNSPFAICGGGIGPSASRLVFTAGDKGLYLQGTKGYGDLGAVSEFVLQGFHISNAGAPGSGLTIGTTGFHISGINRSLVENIEVDGFPVDISVQGARQISWRRVVATARSYTGMLLQANSPGDFTGDMTFDDCSFNAENEVSSAGISIYAANGGAAGNALAAAVVSGLTFTKTNFYKGGLIGTSYDFENTGYSVGMHAGAGGAISDIWFNSGCRWDGFGSVCVRITTNDTTSEIQDIHINDNYMNAYRVAVVSICQGDLGQIYGVHVKDNTMRHMATVGIGLYAGRRMMIHSNEISPVGDGTTICAIDVSNSSGTRRMQDNSVVNNTVGQKPTAGGVQYLVRTQGNLDRFICTGNTGPTTTGTAISDGSVGAKVVSDNLASTTL